MANLGLPRARQLGLAVSTFTLVLLAGIAPRAEACMSTPPPPFCAKTLVLAKAGPPAVFVPAGVAPTFAVPYTAYWNMINVGVPALCPPPSGPGGTFPASVTLNVACIGGPGLAAPIVTPVSLSLGYNPGSIAVTLPAGPPRVCTIVGQVNLTLLDGMMLQANGDSVVCIVDPAPDDPSIPRLDLETLSPPTQNMHPGDQGRFDYRLTNNDPNDSVTVDIDAEMENVSRLPQMSGGGPPGTGVFSPSEPLEGDNFPIGFDDDLTPAGCLFLPSDPGNPALATATETVTLAPGDFHEFSLHTRAFGLCADGSCGEGRLVIDGEFANRDPAVSCTGLVHAVDTSAPPLYQWPGSGAVVQMQPLDTQALAMFGQPHPGVPVQIDNVSFPTKAFIGDAVPLVSPQLQPFENTNNERVRYSYQMFNQNGQGFQAGEPGFFAWSTQFFSPNPSDILQVTQIELHAPAGFETLGPGAIVKLQHDGFGPPLVSVFDTMYQVSGQALDSDTGEIVPIEIIALDLQGLSPVEIGGFAEFQIPPNLGVDYEFVTLNIDVRGFSRGVIDSDLDGVPDRDDNCAIDQNGPFAPDAGGNSQRDTDGDNIGNVCDADIGPAAQDCIVNFLDLLEMRQAFFTTPASPDWNPNADFNGDDIVNFLDLLLTRRQFFGPPGPSGLPNACSP